MAKKRQKFIKMHKHAMRHHSCDIRLVHRSRGEMYVSLFKMDCLVLKMSLSQIKDKGFTHTKKTTDAK